MTSSDTEQQAQAAPADRLRQAAGVVRAEAAALAQLPAPSLAGEYPDVDAVIAHVRAGREMRVKYALAAWLETEARSAAGDEKHDHYCVIPYCGTVAALATADAILAAVSS